MGKEEACGESKFGGGRFLAEGSFPRPCLLLGDTVLLHPSTWMQLSRSLVPALAQLCPWHRRPCRRRRTGDSGSVPDAFLCPGRGQPA